MKYMGAVKAGKLANGLELDKGRVVHIVESGEALCRTKPPANQWSERDLKDATCPKCIRRLRIETTANNLVKQIDEMIEAPAQQAGGET